MRAALHTLGSALLGGAVIWLSTDGGRAITTESARRLQIAENPRPVPPIRLQGMNGDWLSLPGEGPALVEFIYTTCPTICQISGGDFAGLRDHLADAGLSPPMYSISFDPETDDLPALQAYAERHGATGSPWAVSRPEPADLPALLDLFRVTVIPDDWGGYQHNIAVLLIDAEGRFSGAFDTRAFEQIAEAVRAAG